MRIDQADDPQFGNHDPLLVRDLTERLLQDLTRTLETGPSLSSVDRAAARDVQSTTTRSEIRRPDTRPASQTIAFDEGKPPHHDETPAAQSPPPIMAAAPAPRMLDHAADLSVPRILRQPPPDLPTAPAPMNRSPVGRALPAILKQQVLRVEALRDRFEGAPQWLVGAAAVLLVAGLFTYNALPDLPRLMADPSTETALSVQEPKIELVHTTSSPITTASLFAPTPLDAGRRQPEAQLAEASRATALGDIPGARAILQPLAATGDARALFALAETYDPAALAAWGTRTTGEVVEARRLYARALAAGLERARMRLEALE